MDFVTPIFVFILVWWVVIFAVLPFGNKAVENPQVGNAASAPANPRIKQKIMWTTVISIILTIGIMLLLTYGNLNIRDTVKTWSIEQ